MTEANDMLREECPPEIIGGREVASLYDAWQAAALLIGLYGSDAVDYADARKSEMRETGDVEATRTWDLIGAQILRLLRAAPGCRLN